MPILTEVEWRQLLGAWNETRVESPSGSCLHELFEAQVERTLDSTAVVFEGHHLTYRELNHRANQLAHYLRKREVGPDVLVGICVERSVEMVVGLLGILKAGGAYVPLDPTYPQERLAFMVEESQTPVLLTQKRLLRRLPQYRARMICLDADWAAIAQENKENPLSVARPKNLAYVICTSGSTGKPKGVAVPHRAVSRLVMRTNYVNLEPSDRMAQVSNRSFAATTFEIWRALLHGARLVGVPGELCIGGDGLV